MKTAKKKRDPSKEPFASSISSVARRELVDAILTGTFDDTELELAFGERDRAQNKVHAALEDLTIGRQDRFESALDSAHSATATMTFMTWPFDGLARRGAKDLRDRRKAGAASQTSSPRVAVRRAWIKAADTICDERRKLGLPRLKSRELAHEVCKRVPESNCHTVRGVLARVKKQRDKAPSIRASDWSQLVD